jgi:hypothetical protein
MRENVRRFIFLYLDTSFRCGQLHTPVADHAPPSRAEMKSGGAIPLLHPYVMIRAHGKLYACIEEVEIKIEFPQQLELWFS